MSVLRTTSHQANARLPQLAGTRAQVSSLCNCGTKVANSRGTKIKKIDFE